VVVQPTIDESLSLGYSVVEKNSVSIWYNTDTILADANLGIGDLMNQ
jgi:hypothetical protein